MPRGRTGLGRWLLAAALRRRRAHDACNGAGEIRRFPTNLPRIVRIWVGRLSRRRRAGTGFAKQKTKYVGIPDESREYDNLEPGRRRPYYEASMVRCSCAP